MNEKSKDDTQDDEIAELREETRRFAALEAQLTLIGRVLMGILASGLGAVGTLVIKWSDLEVDFSDLEGELHAHEQSSVEITKAINAQLAECKDDLKEITHKTLIDK